MNFKKLLMVSVVLGLTCGFANIATKAAKHAVKQEIKKRGGKGKVGKNVDKKIKKEKRKIEKKAIEAVL